MRVSYLELYAQCKKVLEGCGLPIGCAEEAAEIAAWGEFTGLYGIKQLAEELSALQASDLSKIRILSQDERLVSIDGQGQSSLLSGRIALDMAYAKAAEMGVGIVNVQNSRGSNALIQNVAQAGKRGVCCAIHWVEEDSQFWAITLPDANQPYVVKRKSGHPHKSKQTESFLVICADAVHFAYAAQLESHEETEGSEVIRPEQIQDVWDESNRQGREIDPATWAELNIVASRVLVEATEQSRQRGAGEGAN
ncbi:hypothetical protein J31TS6_57670 [Brevibacillus reuszeri]|uniref:Ldh family oxidoreductase n=1 Tax=Brevibacillus reuszeri TaxID=54915 RepID=UPI001B213EAE|nr:Ldh family oxidoreductase [Brevibacillus reuszeri]GIO09739.1 hypothetical protein J31TS6_57670 [Brevibacillus reuszeri]